MAMETEGIKIGALALVCMLALLILRQFRPEWASLVRVAAAIIFGGLTVTMVATVLSSTAELGGAALPEEMWSILVKALGVAFLTEVAAGICRDSGEASLASWVETAGKLQILLLSLPLIERVLTTATDFLKG